MRSRTIIPALGMTALLSACNMQDKKAEGPDTVGSSQKIYAKGSFGYDREFLRAMQDDLVILGKDVLLPEREFVMLVGVVVQVPMHSRAGGRHLIQR